VLASVVVICYGFRRGIVPDGSMILAALGGILSFAYFVQKQKLEEAQLFRELFDEFNKRYNSMNEELACVLASDSSIDLSVDQKKTLTDYFNLCAEEFLYYSQGYIYPEVWRSWMNGMKVYDKDPRISAYWRKELESQSHYGFTFDN
jgi:hypothetical protein